MKKRSKKSVTQKVSNCKKRDFVYFYLGMNSALIRIRQMSVGLPYAQMEAFIMVADALEADIMRARKGTTKK